MFIFFAALNVRLAFSAPQDLHFRHLSCIHVLVNNIRDNQPASKDERFSETGREINKDIVAPKMKTFTDFRCSVRLSEISNCFSPLQTQPAIRLFL